jgi:hypothetical protein
MFQGVLGFFELGLIILMWNIFWTFLLKGITARYADSAWAQGLAAVFHA